MTTTLQSSSKEVFKLFLASLSLKLSRSRSNEVRMFQNYLFYLQEFEAKILKAMKEDGWDGSEEKDANGCYANTQWTFSGSLFYSIIVITTIGEISLIQT